MPPLHSPKVGAIVPSVSIKASLKKPRRLLSPNTSPHRVGYLHQIKDISLLKAASEVSTGRRVRNALGAQSIEEGLIIAPKLNILQPHSIEQRVVSQIQNMVALMIRKVFL